jgi:hypothetical protein
MVDIFVGTRSTWPDVKESIQDGGSLFSNDDPSGKKEKFY